MNILLELYSLNHYWKYFSFYIFSPLEAAYSRYYTLWLQDKLVSHTVKLVLICTIQKLDSCSNTVEKIVSALACTEMLRMSRISQAKICLSKLELFALRKSNRCWEARLFSSGHKVYGVKRISVVALSCIVHEHLSLNKVEDGAKTCLLKNSNAHFYIVAVKSVVPAFLWNLFMASLCVPPLSSSPYSKDYTENQKMPSVQGIMIWCICKCRVSRRNRGNMCKGLTFTAQKPIQGVFFGITLPPSYAL